MDLEKWFFRVGGVLALIVLATFTWLFVLAAFNITVKFYRGLY